MDGRDAKSERRIVDPVLLRNDFVAALRPVPVCVDDAGHHGHAAGQECLRIVRNPDVYACSKSSSIRDASPGSFAPLAASISSEKSSGPSDQYKVRPSLDQLR